MFLLFCKEEEVMKMLKGEEAITEMEVITLADIGRNKWYQKE